MSLFSGLSVSNSTDLASTPVCPIEADKRDGDGLISSGGDGSSSGGALFSGLNSGGSAFNFIAEEPSASTAPAAGGLSAFNFISDDASAGVPAAAPSGLSAFNFISNDDAGNSGTSVAQPASMSSAFNFMNTGIETSSAPAPAAESSGATSAFSFLSSPQTPTDTPPATTTGSLLGGLNMSMAAPASAPAPSLVDALSEPAAPRKKTRKAMLPGHAARGTDAQATETAAEAPAEATSPNVPESTSPPAELAGEQAELAGRAAEEITKKFEIPAAVVTPAPAPPPAPAPTPAPAPPPTFASAPTPAPPPPLPPQQSQTQPETQPAPSGMSILAGLTQAAAPPAPEVVVATPSQPPPPPVAAQSVSASKPAAVEASKPAAVEASPETFQPPPRISTPTPPVVKEEPAPAPPVVQEEPAPAEETFETAVNLQGVQQVWEVRLSGSMEEQGGILGQQEACLARSQKMTADVASLRQQLASTESEQNRLCDAEQFEEAEALESTIQQLKDTITRRLEEVAGASRQMETLARSLLELTQQREGFAESALGRMQILLSDGEEALADVDERAQRRLSAESNRLESERKRMELACSHLKKDSSNLEEEKQQLQEAIEQETNTHDQERSKAVSERTLVDDEIRELQKTLDAKTKQRSVLNEVVESCDIRIASIRSKFEKQLSRLEGKQKRLEEAQREVDKDAQQVDEMAVALDREREVCIEDAAERKRQLSDIQTESQKLQRLRRLMMRHLQMRSRWQKLLEPHQEMLNKARLQWESVSGDCLALASSLGAREAEGAKLRSQLDAIRIQLPTLEAEKQVAKASRSFKEAGRIAQEIAKAEENRKSYEAELEALQSDLSSQREKLANSRQLEESAQSELMEAESKSAAEELRILQLQIRDLGKLRQHSCWGATERILFEEEERVFKSAQAHLAEKHGISLDTLEEIPSENEADDGEVSEAEEATEAVATANEEPANEEPAEQISPDVDEPTAPATEPAEEQVENPPAPEPEPAPTSAPAPPPPPPQEDVESLRQQLASLEAEQDSLAEAEQFEEAEALEASVQELKDAIARSEAAGCSSTAEGQCSGESAGNGFAVATAAPEENDSTPHENGNQDESF